MSNLITSNGKRKQHRADSSRKRHSAENKGNRTTSGKKKTFSSWRGGYRGSRQEEVSFFGDSFVRLFSLVKNRGLRVRGYKGATAKGLTKVDNSNRKDILKQLRRRPNTTRAVFVFGNVDVQMSYYFCKYARSPPEMIDFDAIAKDYVDFVANLPISEAIVVGVYPSPLVDDEVVASLGNYGILNDDQQATVEAADVLLNARQTRVQYFNSRLALYCAQRGVTFVDLFNEMTDETNALKPQYRDISSRNIHVVWETTLLLWLDKFPWLRSRTPRGFIQSLQKSMDDYFVEKRDRVTKQADGGFSWAKKSHIASHVGIAMDTSKTLEDYEIEEGEKIGAILHIDMRTEEQRAIAAVAEHKEWENGLREFQRKIAEQKGSKKQSRATTAKAVNCFPCFTGRRK